MEHRFDFDEDRPRVVITLSGCLTVDAVRGYQLALYSHPRWHPGIDAVVDMRDVKVGDFSSEEIRTVAGAPWIDPSIRHDGRVATVVGPDAALFGLIRMFNSYVAVDDRMDGPTGRVFKSLDDAETWLAQPIPEPQPGSLVDALRPQPEPRVEPAGN